MTPDSPLHRALTAWRVAERRLSMTGVDDPSRPSLVAEVERRRLAYQAQFDAVEDVAGHGAPYADDEPGPAADPDADAHRRRRRTGGQRQLLTAGGPACRQARGGPASIRRRSAVASADQSASIHHVARASAWSRAVSAAAAGSSAGVVPSTTMSNGPVRPSRARVPASQPTISVSTSGPAGPPSGPAAWTTTPSQRAARRIDRACGHAPTTQTGIRGRWTGVGRKVIGPNR